MAYGVGTPVQLDTGRNRTIRCKGSGCQYLTTLPFVPRLNALREVVAPFLPANEHATIDRTTNGGEGG